MFYLYVDWISELIVDDMPFSAWGKSLESERREKERR